MIFLLRILVYSFLIFLGFHFSTRSRGLRKVVSVVYAVVLLYYTFLCRIKITVDVSASDYTTITTSRSVAEQIWQVIRAIFGMDSTGHLAGVYWQAFVLNILLFVPMGYLVLLWMIDGDSILYSAVNTGSVDSSPVKKESITRKNLSHKAVVSILICIAVSTVIEIGQEITKLGMLDALDILANSIGGGAGVTLTLVWMRHSSARHA